MQEEEQFFDENDILAQISVYVDGQIDDLMFACDWTDEEKSLSYVGEIFFQLKYGNLLDKMLFTNVHTTYFLIGAPGSKLRTSM